MKERKRGEATIYPPQEVPNEVFCTLCTQNFRPYRETFGEVALNIAEGSMGDGHYAFLTCMGVYLLNDEQKPVIIALGEIDDPHQLTERGDTCIFVMPETMPGEKDLKDYISNALSCVATDYEGDLYEDLEVEVERSLGLIIGHGKFKGTSITKGGFISVDKRSKNFMYPPEEKSWPQRVAELGEITDGFILRLAQEIGKEIGVDVIPPL